MLNPTAAFSSFSVNDLAAAKEFYSKILGLEVEEGKMGLVLNLPGGGEVFVYPKDDHQPATYTALNLDVESIDSAVQALADQGVTLERYENAHQDEAGISRGKAAGFGPDIAWFKDPAGNILAVIER